MNDKAVFRTAPATPGLLINEVCSEIFKEELRSGGKIDVWGQFMIFFEALNHWFTFVTPLMRVSMLKTKTFVKTDMSEIKELARNEDRAPVLTSLLATAEGPLPSFKFLLDLCQGCLFSILWVEPYPEKFTF